MRRWLVTIAVAVLYVARLGADLTITTTTTLEGPMAAAGGGNMAPKIVTRVKGNKSRTDIEMGDQTMITLIDLTTKQTILLRPADKTAQLLGSTAPVGPTGKPLVLPKINSKVKPTGQKREISGQQCDEFAVEMLMDMSAMGASPDMPEAAAAMLKDVRMTMNGFVWVAKGAPGAAEYQTFQTGAAKLAMSALSGGGSKGMPPGMEQLLTGFAEAPGIPYLTELTLGVEGTGQMAQVMKQMGAMKIISRVTSVATDPVADAMFTVPADYKMIKP